jgi:hypothetical protein
MTSNISAGGFFSAAPAGMTPGDCVQIRMALELSETQADLILISVTGKILRADDSGMAVNFDGNYQMSISPAFSLDQVSGINWISA